MPSRAAAAVAVVGLLTGGAGLAAVDQPHELVRLRGLDKVTARTTTFDVPVGASGQFGTLTVTVRACYTAPPTQSPESAAFLEIADTPPAGDPATVFTGWMFASSPAVSALDHAVYDVWVIECLDPPVAAAAADEPAGEGMRPRRRP